MKYRIAVLLFAAVIFLGLAAPVQAARPVIKSDNSYFDFARGVYVLKGNVSVEVSNRLITAGEAKVSVVSLEVWGTGGITLAQGDIHFSGDSVYVHGSQHNAAINGDVNFQRGGLAITADEAEYNWQTKLGTFRNNVRIDDNGEIIVADHVVYNIATNTYQAE